MLFASRHYYFPCKRQPSVWARLEHECLLVHLPISINNKIVRADELNSSQTIMLGYGMRTE